VKRGSRVFKKSLRSFFAGFGDLLYKLLLLFRKRLIACAITQGNMFKF